MAMDAVGVGRGDSKCGCRKVAYALDVRHRPRCGMPALDGCASPGRFPRKIHLCAPQPLDRVMQELGKP